MLALTVRLACSLAVVVGLMLLLAKLAGRRFQGRAGAIIQVLHRQAIGRGQSVAVLSVGTRVLVVGATEHQISLLTEVEPDEIELPEAEAAGGPDVPDLSDGDTPIGRPQRQVAAGSILSVDTWKQAWAAATKA